MTTLRARREFRDTHCVRDAGTCGRDPTELIRYKTVKSSEGWGIRSGLDLRRIVSEDAVARAFESPRFDQTFDTLLAELD